MQSIINSKDRLHFFQYLEVDIFHQYLRTGIHYFINAVLDVHPALVPLRYKSLQISTIINFLKDFYYLKKYQATYSQNFFHFKRKQISKYGVLKGALIWAVVPYLCQKIDIYYNQIVGKNIEGQRLSKIQKYFIKLYPYVYMLINIIQCIYKFLYLYSPSQKQGYYHLLYHLNQCKLGHLPQPQQSKYPFLQLLKKPGLLMILLGHKILTWYFGRRRNQNKQIKQIKQVPAQNINIQSNNQGYCILCTKDIKNPTMIRHTGYVYCWDCIVVYLKKQQRCPRSGLKATIQSLQILYQ